MQTSTAITDTSPTDDVPRTSTSKRTDYSKGTEMSDAVKAFDAIMVLWKEGTLSECWNDILYGNKPSKSKFARYAGINVKSFHRYVHKDEAKRQQLGTKPGRPKKIKEQFQQEREEHLHQATLDYYQDIIHGPMNPERRLFEYRQKRQKTSRDELFYYRANLKAQFQHERTHAEKTRKETDG